MTDRTPLLSPRRLEAFTDGVFAIAATLLVLDLSVENLGTIASNSDLWAALGNMSASILSFVVSFLLLCMLWIVHTRQFEHVRQVDSTLLWLNSFRLLGIVIIPFTTSLSADYGNYLLGQIVLPLNFLFVLALGWAMWQYVTVPSRGLINEMSEQEVRSTRRNGLLAMLTGVLVVVLAPFVGPWAFVAFAISPAVDAAPRRRRRPRPQRRPEPHPVQEEPHPVQEEPHPVQEG